MEKFSASFERYTVIALIWMLMATIMLATVVVAWSLVHDVLNPYELMNDPKILLYDFGLVVVALVGIELLRILRHLLAAHHIDAALVVETTLIAMCNKIITTNVTEASWTQLLALAGLILALGVAIYAVRRAPDFSPSGDRRAAAAGSGHPD